LLSDDRSFHALALRASADGDYRWSTEIGEFLPSPAFSPRGLPFVLGPGSEPKDIFLSDLGFFHIYRRISMEFIGPGPTLGGVTIAIGEIARYMPSVEAIYRGLEDRAHISLDLIYHGKPCVAAGFSICGADSQGRPIGRDAWSTDPSGGAWPIHINSRDNRFIDLFFSPGQGMRAVQQLPMLLVDIYLGKGNKLRLGMRTEPGAGVCFPKVCLVYKGMTQDKTGAKPGTPRPDGHPDGQFRLSVIKN
jgi:hypothetical protein